MSLYRILVLTLKKKVSLLIYNMMPLLASHLPHVWLSVLMFAKTSPIFLHHYIPGNQEIQQNNTWMFKAHHIWKGSFSQLLHLISCQPFWVKMATWTCKVKYQRFSGGVGFQLESFLPSKVKCCLAELPTFNISQWWAPAERMEQPSIRIYILSQQNHPASMAHRPHRDQPGRTKTDDLIEIKR